MEIIMLHVCFWYKINNSAVFGRSSVGASGRAADRNAYGANGTAIVQYDRISIRGRLQFSQDI
jgi:hypothetical protein